MPKYAFYDTFTQIQLGEVTDLEKIDGFIRASFGLDERVTVTFDTGVPFKAEIKNGRVYINMGMIKREFPCGNHPEKIYAVASGVSLGKNKKRPASCLLVKFRNPGDPLVGNAHVRLRPDGIAEFLLKPDGLGESTETVADLIRDAGKALNEKIFSRFTNT